MSDMFMEEVNFDVPLSRCQTCGALVEVQDHNRHEDWHSWLLRELTGTADSVNNKGEINDE